MKVISALESLQLASITESKRKSTDIIDLIPAIDLLITYRPNLQIHKSLVRIGFEKYGDPDLFSHALLRTIPLRIAANFKIPLVWCGENSTYEHGGPKEIAESPEMSEKWFNDLRPMDQRH